MDNFKMYFLCGVDFPILRCLPLRVLPVFSLVGFQSHNAIAWVLMILIRVRTRKWPSMNIHGSCTGMAQLLGGNPGTVTSSCVFFLVFMESDCDLFPPSLDSVVSSRSSRVFDKNFHFQKGWSQLLDYGIFCGLLCWNSDPINCNDLQSDAGGEKLWLIT